MKALLLTIVSLGLACPLPLAYAATDASWNEVAHWPDFTGGTWEAPGAEGSPHAEDLPLNPAAQQFLQRYGRRYGSGAASCAPRGMPWSLGNQFIYSRGVIVILGAPDFYQVLRRVYMDGRGHDGAEPSYFGHSTGRWEGLTLVIDTVGFVPEELLTEGLPNYGQSHIIERYRLVSPGTLQLQLTVKNPALLTHDWTQTRTYHLQKGEDVRESYCVNNRDQNNQINLSPPEPLPPLPGSAQ